MLTLHCKVRSLVIQLSVEPCPGFEFVTNKGSIRLDGLILNRGHSRSSIDGFKSWLQEVDKELTGKVEIEFRGGLRVQMTNE